MKWWRFVIAAEYRKIFAFRADFWVTSVGQTMVQLFIARALWENIFEATGKYTMEGYTLPMMTLYYLIVPIGNRMLQGENIGFLSREIYDGSFNRYLLYPISFFQYKTLTYLSYSFFYGMQLILVFILYKAFVSSDLSLANFSDLSLGILIFMLASYTFCLLSIFIELISLWADNIWSLMVMCRFFCYFFGGSFVPLAFMPQWLQKILIYTPFPYLISLPVRTIMGLSNWQEILNGFAFLFIWSIILNLSAKSLWNKGQYRYTGVGI
jgi:ABC-2 type transport system permease protein